MLRDTNKGKNDAPKATTALRLFQPFRNGRIQDALAECQTVTTFKICFAIQAATGDATPLPHIL
jgi:hypothetical protein